MKFQIFLTMFKQNQNSKISTTLVDFHCHIDLYPDFERLIQICEFNKIFTLAVTTTPRAWQRNYDLTKNCKYVRSAIGFHPQLVNKETLNELPLWEKYLCKTRYVGEVGIDGSKDFISTLNEQKNAFIQILKKCSDSRNKILSVHSVRSAGLVLDLINEYLARDRGKVVLHWFTGSLEEAKRATNLECFFSINTAMTRTQKGRLLIKELPLERLLTETDGPFIKRSNKSIYPTDINSVICDIANLKNLSYKDTANLVIRNLKNLLTAP